MVTQYEVNMTAPDGGERIVFSGFETECLVASLLPGRTYSFQVRASNRIGVRLFSDCFDRVAAASLSLFSALFSAQFGPWSDSLEAKSGPGVPEAPGAPQAAHRSSHSLALTWSEPCNNGALIGEYRLEMAHHPRQQMARSPSNGSISTADSAEASGKTTPVMDESIDVDLLSFALCHSGTTRQFEVKGLQPWSTYHFRVQVTLVETFPFEIPSFSSTLCSCNSGCQRCRTQCVLTGGLFQHTGLVPCCSNRPTPRFLNHYEPQSELERALQQRVADHALQHRTRRQRTREHERSGHHVRPRTLDSRHNLQVQVAPSFDPTPS